MLRMYFDSYRGWGFSILKEHEMIDKNLVKIAKDVKKMLEEGKTVEEVEKILFEEYYGFEEGDYRIEKEYKTIILTNRIGEAVKILLVDIDKKLEEIEKEFKKWINKYPFYQKFEVYYDRWQDGGFIGTIEEVANGNVEEITIHDVKIETGKEGVKAIFEDWRDYISNSDDWDPEISFYCETEGDEFRLVIVFDVADSENIEIKAKEE